MSKIKYMTLMSIVMVCATLNAQTQDGYVKTLGRPDHKGVPLSGVSVRVKGEHNSVLSNNDGTFSIVLTGKKNGDAYILQEVKKKGYELNDQDVVGRQFAVSDKVRNTIVMVSSTQLQADKQRIENKAYHVAEKNYKAKLDLLEKQKADNAITDEQYRTELLDLQDKFEKYQLLIDGLAEHYAHVDYDLLDEKGQEINTCIENGELERADSLIKMLFDPITALKRNIDALARLNQQIEGADQVIDKAHEDMAAVLKQQEKDAEYLYQLYTIALSRFDNEKAEQYIVLRAELDTTNADWLLDAACYLHYQHKYKKAEDYYFKVSDLYLKQANGLSAVHAITNLANMLFEIHDYESGENMYKLALDVYEEKSKLDEKNEEFAIIKALYGLGSLYCETNRYLEGDELFKKALRIIDALPLYEQDKYAADRSSILDNIATQLLQSQVYINFEESERLYKTALDIRKKLAQNNPQIRKYQHNLSITLNNLAGLYSMMSRFCESETMYYEVLSIREGLVKEDSIAYAPELAQIYYNLGVLYYNMKEFSKSKSNFVDALNIYTRLATRQPMVYSVELSSVINSIAKLSYTTNRLSDCELLLKWDVELLKELIKRNQKAYEKLYAENLSMLAAIYVMNGKYQESEGMLDEATVIYRSLTISRQDLKDDYVTCLSMLSSVCLYLQKFEKAEKLAKEALTLDTTHNYITSSLAIALLLQGKFLDAKIIYIQYKSELKDIFLGDLRQYEEAGVISKRRESDVKKIRQLLEHVSR